MKTSSIFENKVLLALGALILTALFTVWEYFHGGVATHHLFADENLPGVSNWWGLLSIPLLAWIVGALIARRRRRNSEFKQDNREYDKLLLKRFLSALLFGAIISILWELKLENVLPYVILFPLVVSIFRPLHFPEYLLGFVLGLIYTFGGILPIVIGLILLIISFSINKLIRTLRNAFVSKSKI